MSTYEPGRLYLIDVHGVTRAVHYCADGFFRCGEDFSAMATSDLNARPAIVLDPENFYVRLLVKHCSGCDSPEASAEHVADQIRAQITPPEPPMEEPTEWGSVVQTDEGRAVLATNKRETLRWILEDRGWAAWKNLKNPRPYEA